MKHIEKNIGIGMLVFAIGFNLWLYRLEPTATIDPNDNAFQFALVDRTNQIWDYAQQRCASSKLKAQSSKLPFVGSIKSFALCTLHFALLFDHWVPNWAEGYNLPFYYGHVPQILIVGSWRMFNFIRSLLAGLQGETLKNAVSLFTYYHWVIYLLLSLFPLSVFLALRVIRLPWLAAGLGALLASHISTDGLYGLDPPSFLWRGYGLSSQLFAMIWLPLAIAYAWRYFNEDKRQTENGKSVLFLIMTAMGHLGLGMIAMLSVVPLAIAQPTKQTVAKLLILAGTVIFFLSYWVVPIFLADNYHNISFWDPPWKFASYGAKETIIRLLNGDLFDWGRGPWMTTLVIIGLIAASFSASILYSPFSILFLFWLLLYFGRTTWGGLIDLIPGMKEFHLSRFIVGVHAAGLFLAPIGIETIVSRVTYHVSRIKPFVYLFIGLLVYWIIYPQTISYSSHNDRLIKQANENHAKVKADEEALFAALRQGFDGELSRTAQGDAPGRVFAGRGGWWGKDFKIAETPYYMHLSTYGIPTVLWLPETWSPNSDVEQYFSEDQAKDYDLFGIRYVAAPPSQKPQPFWKLIDERETWKLYEIENVNYFTSGVRPAVVATDKRSYGNVVRLWIQSDAYVKGLFPELTFEKDYPRTTGLPNFKMLDEVTYRVPDGTTHNLFQEPPWYQNPTNQNTTNTTPHKPYLASEASSLAPARGGYAGQANNPILPILQMEENTSDMIFKTKVDVPENCTECIVILKQSFHPNWRATIDGEPSPTFTVFPFFLAVRVPESTHDVVFSYEPSRLKIILLVTEFFFLAVLIINAIRTRAN